MSSLRRCPRYSVSFPLLRSSPSSYAHPAHSTSTIFDAVLCCSGLFCWMIARWNGRRQTLLESGRCGVDPDGPKRRLPSAGALDAVPEVVGIDGLAAGRETLPSWGAPARGFSVLDANASGPELTPAAVSSLVAALATARPEARWFLLGILVGVGCRGAQSRAQSSASRGGVELRMRKPKAERHCNGVGDKVWS